MQETRAHHFLCSNKGREIHDDLKIASSHEESIPQTVGENRSKRVLDCNIRFGNKNFMNSKGRLNLLNPMPKNSVGRMDHCLPIACFQNSKSVDRNSALIVLYSSSRSSYREVKQSISINAFGQQISGQEELNLLNDLERKR